MTEDKKARYRRWLALSDPARMQPLTADERSFVKLHPKMSEFRAISLMLETCGHGWLDAAPSPKPVDRGKQIEQGVVGGGRYHDGGAAPARR